MKIIQHCYQGAANAAASQEEPKLKTKGTTATRSQLQRKLPQLRLIDTSGIKAEIVLMPKMSDTMIEGVIAAWHKKVGDSVKTNELLAEIETDKATMEYESYNTGTLLYIGAEAGKVSTRQRSAGDHR